MIRARLAAVLAPVMLVLGAWLAPPAQATTHVYTAHLLNVGTGVCKAELEYWQDGSVVKPDPATGDSWYVKYTVLAATEYVPSGSTHVQYDTTAMMDWAAGNYSPGYYEYDLNPNSYTIYANKSFYLGVRCRRQEADGIHDGWMHYDFHTGIWTWNDD